MMLYFCFFRNYCFWEELALSQELAAPAYLGPCSVTSFSATLCLAGSADRRRQKRHWPQWTMFSQCIKKSARCLQTSPTDIAGTVANVRKCRKTSTLWFLNVRKSQLCFHMTHWDSQASFFATAIWNEINLESIYSTKNKFAQASFSSMCARGFVRSLVFVESRPGCTCPSQNVHRDVIALQRPARAEGCWFNLLIGLLSAMYDVPQCGMTYPHGENPGAVSSVHRVDRGDMDHTELCSVKVSRSLPSACRRLHRTLLLGQLAMCVSPQNLDFVNTERAEVSTLLPHLPLDSVRFPSKFLRNCYLERDQST